MSITTTFTAVPPIVEALSAVDKAFRSLDLKVQYIQMYITLSWQFHIEVQAGPDLKAREHLSYGEGFPK
jgi:hypothetical protein